MLDLILLFICSFLILHYFIKLGQIKEDHVHNFELKKETIYQDSFTLPNEYYECKCGEKYVHFGRNDNF